MGRPRKKRKYTRRKLLIGNGETPDTLTTAQELCASIKEDLAGADPAVARIAIAALASDLAMMARLIERSGP